MPPDATKLAADLLAALDSGRQVAPPSDADPAFDRPAATAVAADLARLRAARGERRVGVKIGFTNRLLWDDFGVRAPIWGAVWDSTCRPLGAPLALGRMNQPRIEPEVMFRLARSPAPGLDAAALFGCIDGLCLGFEIVQSPYPDWRFRAPDTIACGALHAALLTGPFADPRPLRDALAGFDIVLRKGAAEADRGVSANVMSTGPLAALAHLVDLLAEEGSPPLQPGEIVSTGSLTRALPIAPGESWSAELIGLDLPPAGVTFT